MNENENRCNGCIYDSVIEELKRDAERNSDQHREFYTRFLRLRETLLFQKKDITIF